jgi:hypothetical protein
MVRHKVPCAIPFLPHLPAIASSLGFFTFWNSYYLPFIFSFLYFSSKQKEKDRK